MERIQDFFCIVSKKIFQTTKKYDLTYFFHISGILYREKETILL